MDYLLILRLLILLNTIIISCFAKPSGKSNKNITNTNTSEPNKEPIIKIQPNIVKEASDNQNDTLRYLETNSGSIETNNEKFSLNDTTNIDNSNYSNENNQHEVPTSGILYDIQQPSSSEVNYTNQFDLTLQMENAYKNTEYNYTDENSKIIEDAEEVSNQKSGKDNQDEKEYLEWQEKVADFSVAEMLTVKIKATRYAFYEEIKNVPSLIKTAFYNSDRGERVNFFLHDNKKTLLVGDFDKRYGYYEYVVKTPGTYKFILDGTRSRNTKKITFAIHTGNNTDTHLESQNIDKISGRLQNVKKKMKEIKTRQNFFVKNIERYFQNTNKHNRHIVTMSILECIMMFIILIVQFIYLKSLLKNF